ncbi:MAG: aminotransferase class IV [Phycisphaeraceae bacterium]
MPDSQVYINGQYLSADDAHLSVEERGTLFADGVYEVTHYFHGEAFAMSAHVDRLRRSLAGVRIDEPAWVADLPAVSDRLVAQLDVDSAAVYWQVTRGPARRDHRIPAQTTPTVLAMAYAAPAAQEKLSPDAPVATAKAMLAEDIRWKQCWMKTLMLLPNVLARDAAIAAGAADAIFHEDGIITEATASNAFVVRGGEIHTHPTNGRILPGITRDVLLALARDGGIRVHEQAPTVDELRTADEVFLSSTTTNVTAITHVDGKAIGDGQPGPVTRQLHTILARHILQSCNAPVA